MALLSNIKDSFAVLLGKKQAADNTVGLQRPVSDGMASYDDIAVKNDRKSKIQDCREMDETDPRIERCHTLLATDASVNGFQINIVSGLTEKIKTDAKVIIDTTQSKCNIQSNINGWSRDMLVEGDLFGEIGIDESAQEVTKIKKLEPLITFTNVDQYGKTPEGKPAYKQTDPYIYEQIIAEFWHYQIAHTGWKKRDGKPYGTPLFSSSRKYWRRLDQAEISVVGMRRLDAGDMVHWNGFNSMKEIMEFRETNKDSLNNPMRPVNYYYTTGNVQMDKQSGSRNLGELNDLKYLEGLVFMPSGVPIALVSGGREEVINRDVFEDQLKAYYRQIQIIDDIMESWLRRIFDIALMLKGIDPETLKYTFNWGAKDRDDIDIKIKRALNLQLLGYPFEIINMVCDLDGVEYEDVIEKIKNQIADGVVPYGLGAKMDPNLLMLLTGIAGKQGKQESLAEDIRKLRELAESEITSSGSMEEFRRGKYV